MLACINFEAELMMHIKYLTTTLCLTEIETCV